MTLDKHRTRRNRSIRHALMTSAVARLSGVLLQVISLPVAAIALGPAGFSIYAMFGAFLAAMTLSNLGMAQATTLHMSRALAAGNMATARAMLSASLAIVGAIAVTVALVAVGLILWSPLPSLIFAQHLTNSPPPIATALFVCAMFVATQLLMVLEAAQLAQQKQHRLNLLMAVGTFVAAGAVWWASATAPSVLTILMAVHVPVLLARAVNAVVVWTNLRPQLADFGQGVNRGRAILTDGLRFVSGTTISNFLAHQLGVLVVGALSSPAIAASFAAVMNAILLAAAVFGYVMSPFRSSLPEAQMRGDQDWVRRKYKTVMSGAVAYAAVPAILFSLFGTWLFGAWYGSSISPQRALTTAAGLYLVVYGIEVVNFAFISSLGAVQTGSRWLLAKGIGSGLSVLFLARLGFPEWTIWSLLAVNVLFSLIPLSLLANQLLSGKREPIHG
jgi:O-antigen/teichoic acid export membrane protein